MNWKFLLVLFTLLSGPVVAGDGQNSPGAFRVVVSIKPIHSLVAGLMEGIAAPELLVTGEHTPYDYRLTAAQRAGLSSANLIVWVGPELEDFLREPLQAVGPNTRIMELLSSPDLKILPSPTDDGRRDPYLWLDSRNAIILVDELTQLLIAADPSHSHVYLRNRPKVLRRLKRIDRELEYGYRDLKSRPVVLYYDTQQYFAQAYALRVGAVVSPSPNRPATAATILDARLGIRDGLFPCLLTEAGVPANNLSLLTEDGDVNLGELDSFATHFPAGPDLYGQLMHFNNEVIRRCISLPPGTAMPDLHAADIVSPGEQPGGHFILTDQDGQQLTDQDMLGKYQLIYFGYTYCPDVCPTSLHVMKLALDALGDQAQLIQPYFITVDPERDTVQLLHDYVRYFDPRLIGLTGTRAMIDRVTSRYHVKYEKLTELAPSPDLYLVNHSAGVYLMGPDGRFIAKFAYGIAPAQMASRLREILP